MAAHSGVPVVATPAGETLLRHVQALRMLEGSTLRELGAGATPGEPVAWPSA
jgi:LysR family transcriptional regulator (chromosome initiation inhibitor)